MSAFGELAVQCEKRGWRLCLCGSYPDGKSGVGFIVNNLAVRSRTDRDLLATAVAGPQQESLDAAAVDCAKSLAKQGLIS